MSDKKIAYSEIFHSIQGEGHYTGRPTAWLRFFLCNLQCDGFGQKDPTDPSTYVLPYKQIKVEDYRKLEDLPVWKYGCDSSYSWSAKFKHLQHKHTAAEICDRIRQSMYHPMNPEGLFNKKDGTEQHLCFTGGEPLMKHAQQAAISIVDHFVGEGDYPHYMTWETNGTQELTSEFANYFSDYPGEVFFSVSPKLWRTSGEKPEDAIKPEIVKTYTEVSSWGQLKFVVNGTEESWNELEETVVKFRDAGVTYPVWIMGVGATLEAQKGTEAGYIGEAKIATEAFKRGYNYSSRVHVHIWGNTMGT
jgi:6-pyruvoyltetrahydropterin 2'-reductase